MKARGARYGYRAAALRIWALGTMLVVSVLISASVFAADGAPRASDWERLDQVLVIPPVYKPDAKGNTSAATPSASSSSGTPAARAGCGSSTLNVGPDGAVSVSGTADCTNTNAPAAEVPVQDAGETAAPQSAPQAAGGSAVQSAESGTAEADAGGVAPSVGTLDDYQQQEAADEAAARAGLGRPPPAVVVGPPMLPYYLPRTYAVPTPPMAPMYVPQASFPRATWMPQPVSPMVQGPPAWMPRAGVPTVAVRPPMFIPPAVGSLGVTPGAAGIGGWSRR